MNINFPVGQNRRNDIQHNVTQHNDIQHNVTQHNNKLNTILGITTLGMMLSVVMLSECYYPECHLCEVSIMLRVANKPIKLSVVEPSVAAPQYRCEQLCHQSGGNDAQIGNVDATRSASAMRQKSDRTSFFCVSFTFISSDDVEMLRFLRFQSAAFGSVRFQRRLSSFPVPGKKLFVFLIIAKAKPRRHVTQYNNTQQNQTQHYSQHRMVLDAWFGIMSHNLASWYSTY
jgi:hypothetical protein